MAALTKTDHVSACPSCVSYLVSLSSPVKSGLLIAVLVIPQLTVPLLQALSGDQQRPATVNPAGALQHAAHISKSA